MSMRPAVPAFLLLISLAAAASGAPAHQWSRNFGEDNSNQAGYEVRLDSHGNAILMGNFDGAMDFGGGVIASQGGGDFFVAKFDQAGAHIWSRGFGDAQIQFCSAICLDDQDNIVLAGWNRGAVDFGGGPLNTSDLNDLFIAKLDPNGAHLWSAGFGGIGNQVAYGVACGPLGEIYLGGSFLRQLDFGIGEMDNLSESLDGFLAKFDAGGAPLWQRWFHAVEDADVVGLSLGPSGELAVAGDFGGQLFLGGPPLTTAGGRDIFTAAFDADGALQWSHRYGNAATQDCGDVCHDGAGNLALVGYFESSVDFGGGAIASHGGLDVCLASFGPDGSHRWSRGFGDSEAEFGFDVSADPLGNVALTGYFKGSIDFGGGPLASAGNWDIFFAGFDAGGAHAWSLRYGGDQIDKGYGVFAGPAGEILLTGTFSIEADFGGGVLGNGTHQDAFLASYRADLTASPPLLAAAPALGAYPNPLREGTRVSFVNPNVGSGRVDVYDAAGRLVRRLHAGLLPAGESTFRWDGRDDRGRRAAAGVYHARATGPAGSAAIKMILLR